MTLAELENAKAESLAEIAAAKDAAVVEALRVKYIGRNGSIPALIKAMKDVPKEERPAFGKAVQAWRAEVEAALGGKAQSGGEKPFEGDLTQPGRWRSLGARHPLTRVIEETARCTFAKSPSSCGMLEYHGPHSVTGALIAPYRKHFPSVAKFRMFVTNISGIDFS